MNDEREDLRKEVDAADDTGLVAGEELITQAETMLPLLQSLPREKLHAALPADHAAHAKIDELHTHLQSDTPDRGTVERHVNALRAIPELEAIVVNWWDSPKVQRFIAMLSQVGL
jgi:hypothetical protein